jgi:hypothetical protein
MAYARWRTAEERLAEMAEGATAPDRRRALTFISGGIAQRKVTADTGDVAAALNLHSGLTEGVHVP